MKPIKTILNGRSVTSSLTAAAFGMFLAQSEPSQAPKTTCILDSASTPQNSSAGDKASHVPILRTSNGPSLNWSGYAVSASDVTSVTGTFTVPEIGPPGSIGGLPPDIAAWVGIAVSACGTV